MTRAVRGDTLSTSRGGRDPIPKWEVPLSIRPNVLTVLVLGCLPAVGVGVPATHASFVASFFYACGGSHHAPRVRTEYTAAGRPAPRPAASPVGVYMLGHAPARRYQTLGKVEVLATSTYTRTDELTEYASRSARRMGGDAIVDVDWQDAASTHPKAGDQGLLILTAVVARWE